MSPSRWAQDEFLENWSLSVGDCSYAVFTYVQDTQTNRVKKKKVSQRYEKARKQGDYLAKSLQHKLEKVILSSVAI